MYQSGSLPGTAKAHQVGPKSLPASAFGRATTPQTCSLLEIPNKVLINQTPGKPIGFFFGSSASFAALSNKNLAANYTSFGQPTAGTVLNLRPTAWSGSASDAGEVTFIYKGGLDGDI